MPLPPSAVSHPFKILQRSPGSGQTQDLLSVQWQNPTNVTSILSVIGGDVILKALAQLAGGDSVIVPVAFSFGWVAYSFNSLLAVIGDGRLMPVPDYSAIVINAESGYRRKNKSWVIGRLLRDFSTPLDNDVALKITVFEALPRDESRGNPSIDWIWCCGFGTILLQLGIAAIPCGMYGDWGILMITAVGTLLALATGALPQWYLEKWACRPRTKKVICITGGNGTRYAMVIIGNAVGLDLEDLAAADSPRLRHRGETVGGRRRWSRKVKDENGQYVIDQYGHCKEEVIMAFGYPAAYIITQLLCLMLAALWIVFLITVSGLIENQWYLMAVGSIGMLQNVIAAGSARSSRAHGINLQEIETFQTNKVMDALMDLEDAYPKAGRALLPEFFHEKHLRDDEKNWWDGQDRAAYEKVRRAKRANSLVPPPRISSIPWMARRSYQERSKRKHEHFQANSHPNEPGRAAKSTGEDIPEVVVKREDEHP